MCYVQNILIYSTGKPLLNHAKHHKTLKALAAAAIGYWGQEPTNKFHCDCGDRHWDCGRVYHSAFNCRVGTTPLMCNRVTNVSYIGILSKLAVKQLCF